jgi:tellurite resistance protein
LQAVSAAGKRAASATGSARPAKRAKAEELAELEEELRAAGVHTLNALFHVREGNGGRERERVREREGEIGRERDRERDCV